MTFHSQFIPEPHHRSRHTIAVDADPTAIWPFVRDLDLSKAWRSRTLFTLRGLRGLKTSSDLERLGFRPLKLDEPNGAAWGVIGQPWASRIVDFEASDFAAFNTPGNAKVSWTFYIDPAESGSILSTETRIACTDEESARKFSRYWRLVGPFSGFIRTDALNVVKRQAEAA